MIIDFLIHLEPHIEADITDYVGIGLLIVAYFYMKGRRAKNRKVEETIVS